MIGGHVVIVSNQVPRGFVDGAHAEAFVDDLPLGTEYFRGGKYHRADRGWYRRGEGRITELTTAAPCWTTGNVSVEVVTL